VQITVRTCTAEVGFSTLSTQIFLVHQAHKFGMPQNAKDKSLLQKNKFMAVENRALVISAICLGYMRAPSAQVMNP